MRNPNKKLIIFVWTDVATHLPEYNFDAPLESSLMGDGGESAIITESANLFFYRFDNKTGWTFEGI